MPGRSRLLPHGIDRRILRSRGGAPAHDDAGDFRLLVESDIGGRPIATFKLTTPIEVRSRDGGTRFVDVVEIPSPKDGSPYGAGLEHVEFVVGDGSHESPANGDAHRTTLTAWMEMHPSVPWNAKEMWKLMQLM